MSGATLKEDQTLGGLKNCKSKEEKRKHSSAPMRTMRDEEESSSSSSSEEEMDMKQDEFSSESESSSSSSSEEDNVNDSEEEMEETMASGKLKDAARRVKSMFTHKKDKSSKKEEPMKETMTSKSNLNSRSPMSQANMSQSTGTMAKSPLSRGNQVARFYKETPSGTKVVDKCNVYSSNLEIVVRGDLSIFDDKCQHTEVVTQEVLKKALRVLKSSEKGLEAENPDPRRVAIHSVSYVASSNTFPESLKITIENPEFHYWNSTVDNVKSNGQNNLSLVTIPTGSIELGNNQRSLVDNSAMITTDMVKNYGHLTIEDLQKDIIYSDNEPQILRVRKDSEFGRIVSGQESKIKKDSKWVDQLDQDKSDYILSDELVAEILHKYKQKVQKKFTGIHDLSETNLKFTFSPLTHSSGEEFRKIYRSQKDFVFNAYLLLNVKYSYPNEEVQVKNIMRSSTKIPTARERLNERLGQI